MIVIIEIILTTTAWMSFFSENFQSFPKAKMPDVSFI